MVASSTERPPTHWLGFCSQTALSANQKAELAQLARSLASARTWSLSEPQFIDQVPAGEDDEGCVGLALELYNTFPPHSLPLELEKRQLEDAEALIVALWDWSDRNNVAFDAEYAGEHIGAIQNGFLDEGLGLVFLEAWRRELESRASG